MFIDWSFWKWLDFIAFLCFMVIPPPMFIVTWLYVNKTPHKQRLIELGYGTNNDWYRGKRIDFVDANYVISLMAGVSYGMRFRKNKLKKPTVMFSLAPNLHLNENYNKLINEFGFFVKWESVKYILIIFGMTVLFIGMGIDKGWFNF